LLEPDINKRISRQHLLPAPIQFLSPRKASLASLANNKHASGSRIDAGPQWKPENQPKKKGGEQTAWISETDWLDMCRDRKYNQVKDTEFNPD